MLVKRIFPSGADEVRQFVVSEAKGVQCVVVQAGHFLLYYDVTEALVLPCIKGELTGPRSAQVAEEYGYFPAMTWNFAIPLLDSLPAAKKWAMVLVNDWQYLPDEVDRFVFYRSHPALPESYHECLDAHPAVKLLHYPPRLEGDTGEHFSEKSLRKAYEKHIKRLVKSRALPENARVETGKVLTCSLEDAIGGRTEIYCSEKRAGCTHEVAELMSALSELCGADMVINVFPLVCKEYVAEGTELGHTLFRHGIKKTINIGLPATQVQTLPDPFAKAEVTLHEFSRKAKEELPLS